MLREDLRELEDRRSSGGVVGNHEIVHLLFRNHEVGRIDVDAEEGAPHIFRGHVDRRVRGDVGLFCKSEREVQDVLGIHRAPGAPRTDKPFRIPYDARILGGRPKAFHPPDDSLAGEGLFPTLLRMRLRGRASSSGSRPRCARTRTVKTRSSSRLPTWAPSYEPTTHSFRVSETGSGMRPIDAGRT